MKYLFKSSKLIICLVLIVALAIMPANVCFSGGEDQSDGLAFWAAITAVCLLAGGGIAGIENFGEFIASEGSTAVLTEAGAQTLVGVAIGEMAVELYNGHAVVGSIGSGESDDSYGSEDVKTGNITYVKATLSTDNIPMDGISSLEVVLQVVDNNGNYQSLPSDHKMMVSHTNLYAILYDDSGAAMATGGQDPGGIDTSAGDVNVAAVSPAVVPQGGVAQVDYSIASQAKTVAVQVKDSAGQAVYHLNELNPDKDNVVPFAWNTKDMTGKQVPSGTYSVDLQAVGSGGTQYSNTQIVTVAQDIGQQDTELRYVDGSAKARVISPAPGSTDNKEDRFTAKYVNADGVTLAQTSFAVHYETLATPDPDRSTISANPSQVVADGQTGSMITVVAKDSNGNVLPGRNVSFSSSRGSKDVFTDTFVVTDPQGVAETSVSSNISGQSEISAMAGNVVLNSKATVTFNSPSPSNRQMAMVNEAQRYDHCASWWYYRKYLGDDNSTSGTSGVIYSFGNKDSIELFNKKLQRSPNAQNWAGYLYETGLFYNEWKQWFYQGQAKYSPFGLWAGIDCSGLIQRCANAAGYSRIPYIVDYSGSDPYHVSPENNIIINNFNDPKYSVLVTSSGDLNLDSVQVGDIVHFPALGQDIPQHWGIISAVNGSSLDQIMVINAYGGGTDASIHKVREMSLSSFGRPFDILKLIE